MNSENIAKVCHKVNRAYCIAIGDFDTVPWEEAPRSQTDSCIAGVEFLLANPHNPEESHEAWLKYRADEGWVFGEEKDEEKKTHPCMVPYAELPAEHKVKDYIFAAVVNAIAKIEDPVPVETPVTSIVASALQGMTGSVQDISNKVTSLIPIKYVGVRDLYKDGTFGTGLTFFKGETKLISPARAVSMLKHPGVYVLGEMPGEPESTEDVAADTPDAEEGTEEHGEDEEKANSERLIQDAKDSILNMKNKDPILEFAARNFSGVTLDKKHTVADLQNEAIQMIDQFGLTN